MFISPETIATLFAALCIALSAHFAKAMTLDQISRVDKTAENHELLSESELQKEIDWLNGLSRENPKDADLVAQQARLYFYMALNNDNKEIRITKYQRSIDRANEALALDSKNVLANFWKGASIGRQGLDVGVTKSLKGAAPMKECLEIVREKNERLEHAGPYRALGRLYYKLPGWPLSFGNNKTSLEYLKKAVELDPDYVGNHAYYAEVLVHEGKGRLAREQIDLVLNAPVDPKHKRETNEYRKIAEDAKAKLD